MPIAFDASDDELKACLPRAWVRTWAALNFARFFGSVLIISVLFWAVGMPEAMWAGWVGATSFFLLGLRRRSNTSAERVAQSRSFAVELCPYGIEWTTPQLDVLRYSWQWILRAAHSEKGLSLQTFGQGECIVVPKVAFRTCEEFRAARDYAEDRVLDLSRERSGDALVPKYLPPRTDLGEIHFHDHVARQRLPVTTPTMGYCVFGCVTVGLGVTAWLYLSGSARAIVGGASMFFASCLCVTALHWLENRRRVCNAPPIGEMFSQITTAGVFCGHRLADRLIPWSSLTGIRYADQAWEILGPDSQVLASMGKAEFSSLDAAHDFFETIVTMLQSGRLSEDDEEQSLESSQLDEVESELLADVEEGEKHTEALPPAPRARSVFERLLVAGAYFAPLIFFGLGILGNWPHIELEHRRMTPWRVPLVWMSEVTGLFWYLMFGLGLLLNKRLARGATLWVCLAFAAGFGIDLAVTYSDVRDEHQGFARSVLSPAARATGASYGKHLGTRMLWRLRCEFRDQQGANHVALFDSMNTKFPEVIEQAALAGRFPMPLEIRYDPQWPQRYWLAASDSPHHNRLYIISMLVIGTGTLLGLLFLFQSDSQANVFPAEAAPFLMASFFYGLSGTLYLLLRSAA